MTDNKQLDDNMEKGYWKNLEDLPTGQDPADDDGLGG